MCPRCLTLFFVTIQQERSGTDESLCVPCPARRSLFLTAHASTHTSPRRLGNEMSSYGSYNYASQQHPSSSQYSRGLRPAPAGRHPSSASYQEGMSQYSPELCTCNNPPDSCACSRPTKGAAVVAWSYSSQPQTPAECISRERIHIPLTSASLCSLSPERSPPIPGPEPELQQPQLQEPA